MKNSVFQDFWKTWTSPEPQANVPTFFSSFPKDIRSLIIDYLDYDNVHKLAKCEDESMVRQCTLRLHSPRQVFVSVKEILQWPELRESSLVVYINSMEEFQRVAEMKKFVPRLFIKYHQFGPWDATKFMIFLSLFEKIYGPCITEQIKEAENYRGFSQTNPPRFLSFERGNSSSFAINWISPDYDKNCNVCMQLIPRV